MEDSELDHLIPPEIIGDQLFDILRRLASDPSVRRILEIGSSSGEGSTRALYEGVSKNKESCLFCLEVSKPRFSKLVERYESSNQVFCFNMSSVDSIFDFPSEEEIEKFYYETPSKLNNFPLERVLGWLRQDILYIMKNGIWDHGISYIRNMYEIKDFDLVLIDGSEFTGQFEFKKVYGSKILVLDDICSFKNYWNYHNLLKDQNYKLIEENKNLRGGFAIFKKEGI